MKTNRLPLRVPSVAPARCFRTDAAGRIALTPELPRLFAELRRFPRIALQTRHVFARLVHLAAPPQFYWTHDGIAVARDLSGALELHPRTWHRVAGRLAECPCCRSPGRIEASNVHGLDFLQLCATSETPATGWADYLLDVLHRGPEIATVPASPSDAEIALPHLPPGSRMLNVAPEALPALFLALGDTHEACSVELVTPECRHVRDLQVHRVDCDETLLSVSDASATTLQIGLPAVRALACSLDVSRGMRLHLLGADHSVLLTLGRPVVARGQAWHAALATAFDA